MKYFGKADQTAKAIVKAFENGDVPAALSQLYIEDAAEKHSSKYSILNRFIVAIHGYTDAMGMKQWNKIGRKVKKGEKAIYILAPVIRKIKGETTLNEKGEPVRKEICIGFKGVQVFGLEQTEGKPIKQGEEVAKFINELPLREVAEKWGLKINVYNGNENNALGMYTFGTGIAVGTKNLSTWAHELAHAADDKLGNLKKSRNAEDRALAEVVAEFAGAVLLKCIGKDHEADLGGAWEYIKTWSNRTECEPIDACRKVFKRVVDAVDLILEEAGEKEAKEVA